MALDKAMKNLKFDARLIEQNLASGQITKEEYEAYLKSLPDSGAQAAPLNLEDERSSLNGSTQQH